MGTSANGVDWERAILAGALERRLPVLAVLDFWSNYRTRFNSIEPADLPDAIAVMDDVSRRDMVALGFPADRVRVTGQPAYDAWLEDDPVAFRQAGATPAILFLSQPLEELYGSDCSVPGHPGYTERQVLNVLIDALAEMRNPFRLTIRPHPREQADALPRLARCGIDIEVSRDGTLVEAIERCDLVVGMTTMALIEAQVRCALVLSVQPGAHRRDPLPAAAAPAVVRCYESGDVRRMLHELLFDPEWRASRREAALAARPVPGAARRVADWMIDLMNPGARRGT
jgi:hypothetical protein